jgi:(E)-4-hydroxy-3-methylbut-2-enyl-diphosphate synthase
MRIGTNHGSLSDRIMNRYGDTPRGMLESALEFARVCRKNAYHDFMFSMKSSNPQVMILAYRLLVAEMMALGWDYPLHLGVTEAGEGEDGRIKSAMGIGSLLLDGIGDTIRVSLTEDAWNEIDPCKRLIALAQSYEETGIEPFEEQFRNIEEVRRRPLSFSKEIGLHRDGSVMVCPTLEELQAPDLYKKLGCDIQLGRPKLKSSTSDCLVIREGASVSPPLKALKECGVGLYASQYSLGEVPIMTLKQAAEQSAQHSRSERFALHSLPKNPLAVLISHESPEQWAQLKEIKPALLIFAPESRRLHTARRFFDWLQAEKIEIPVILKFSYRCSKEDLVIRSAAEYGALLCDCLGEGIWIEAPYELEFLRNLSFNILQAARMRSFKTDFISCPSCGRTLFDLQDVSKRIRARTSHLPGVKIAIMGCIVNGPGEMADAHFGYVGSKPGKIDLYVGKECVQKDIDFADADERLIELIKQHGRWVEPEYVA